MLAEIWPWRIRLNAALRYRCEARHNNLRSQPIKSPLRMGVPCTTICSGFWSRMAAPVVLLACVAGSACAGDRLGFTGAVTAIEGAAGGGLVPWALIGGLGTDTQVGASGFVTAATTQDFSLHAAGASVDWDDRVEFSFARQRFAAGSVIPGLTLGQDIAGIKVRIAGDAVFAPDQWLPQLALGAQWKQTLDFDVVPHAVGAASGRDVDLYVAATKLYFAAVAGRNLILDASLRRTRANQFGLLGFGGSGSRYTLNPEGSAAVFVTPEVLLGAEYRHKPDNLAAFREGSASDLFLAWGPDKHLTLTIASVSLGSIAGKADQRGAYASLWVGF